MSNTKSNRCHRVSFHSDVDAVSNHKSTPVYQAQLSIVEEGDIPELPSESKQILKLPPTLEDNHSTPNSSSENLHSSKQSKNLLSPDGNEKDQHFHHNSSRRGSTQLLQELLSSRRSSTIMAALRRPSLMLFRSKHDPDPNDPANKPEAIEQRRKNRRIGK